MRPRSFLARSNVWDYYSIWLNFAEKFFHHVQLFIGMFHYFFIVYPVPEATTQWVIMISNYWFQIKALSLSPFHFNEYQIFTAYSTFCRAQGPVEFESFKNTVILDLEKAEDRLNHSWFPGIINVFADKNTFVGPRADKLDSFYNSVTTLISNQVHVSIFVLS